MVAIITRRNAMAGGAGLAVAGVLGSDASAIPVASVEPPRLPIENGATLRVLRPAEFVDPDETIFRESVLSKVDPSAPSGVAIVEDFAAGPTASEHTFEGACFEG